MNDCEFTVYRTDDEWYWQMNDPNDGGPADPQGPFATATEAITNMAEVANKELW